MWLREYEYVTQQAAQQRRHTRNEWLLGSGAAAAASGLLGTALGGDVGAPPIDPSEGFLGPLVQAIGRAGFIEPFSVFPVRYVDETIAIFNFAMFTVTTQRV